MDVVAELLKQSADLDSYSKTEPICDQRYWRNLLHWGCFWDSVDLVKDLNAKYWRKMRDRELLTAFELATSPEIVTIFLEKFPDLNACAPFKFLEDNGKSLVLKRRKEEEQEEELSISLAAILEGGALDDKDISVVRITDLNPHQAQRARLLQCLSHKSIQQGTALVELVLRDAKLDQACSAAVTNLLKQATEIRVVDLSENQLGNDAVMAICGQISEQKSLQELKLNGTGITGDCANALAELIKRQSSLKVLELDGNKLRSCETLALAIRNHSGLVRVSVARNSLLGEGFIKNLCPNTSSSSGEVSTRSPRQESRPVPSSLTNLNLAGVGLKKTSQDLLSQLLQSQSKLESLVLGQNNIGRLQQSFITALERHSSLRELDLSGNELNEDDGHSVAYLISRLNKPNEDDERSVADLVSQVPKKLWNLNLAGNDFGPIAGILIARAIQDNAEALENLNLSGNRLEHFHSLWKQTYELCKSPTPARDKLELTARNWTGLQEATDLPKKPISKSAISLPLTSLSESEKILYEKLQTCRQIRNHLERELLRTTVLTFAISPPEVQKELSYDLGLLRRQMGGHTEEQMRQSKFEEGLGYDTMTGGPNNDKNRAVTDADRKRTVKRGESTESEKEKLKRKLGDALYQIAPKTFPKKKIRKMGLDPLRAHLRDEVRKATGCSEGQLRIMTDEQLLEVAQNQPREQTQAGKASTVTRGLDFNHEELVATNDDALRAGVYPKIELVKPVVWIPSSQADFKLIDEVDCTAGKMPSSIPRRLAEFSTPTIEESLKDSQFRIAEENNLMFSKMLQLDRILQQRTEDEVQADALALSKGRIQHHISHMFLLCHYQRASIELRLDNLRKTFRNTLESEKAKKPIGLDQLFERFEVGDSKDWMPARGSETVFYRELLYQETDIEKLRQIASKHVLGPLKIDKLPLQDLRSAIENSWLQHAKSDLERLSETKLRSLLYSLGCGLLSPKFVDSQSTPKLLSLVRVGLWGGPKALLTTDPDVLVGELRDSQDQSQMLFDCFGIVPQQQSAADQQFLLVTKWRLAEVHYEASQLLLLPDPGTYLETQKQISKDLLGPLENHANLKEGWRDRFHVKPRTEKKKPSLRQHKLPSSATILELPQQSPRDKAGPSPRDQAGPSPRDQAGPSPRDPHPEQSIREILLRHPPLLIHKNRIVEVSVGSSSNNLELEAAINERITKDIEKHLPSVLEPTLGSKYKELCTVRDTRDDLLRRALSGETTMGRIIELTDGPLELRIQATRQKIATKTDEQLKNWLFDQLKYEIFTFTGDAAINSPDWDIGGTRSQLTSYIDNQVKNTTKTNLDPWKHLAK
eukprot:c14046_g1_i2.p1 GENE.c14046_g1_i2~~c14046_g1_i2.p1  ORF type:complete len:1538 (+),score=258.26 c14046_g1_i2:626-4615(+)